MKTETDEMHILGGTNTSLAGRTRGVVLVTKFELVPDTFSAIVNTFSKPFGSCFFFGLPTESSTRIKYISMSAGIENGAAAPQLGSGRASFLGGILPTPRLS